MTLRLHWSGAHVTTTVNYVPTQALRQRLGRRQSMIANLVEKEQNNIQIRQQDFEYRTYKRNLTPTVTAISLVLRNYAQISTPSQRSKRKPTLRLALCDFPALCVIRTESIFSLRYDWPI